MILLLALLTVGSNAVITRPVANMFSAPSADTDVVSQAIYGTNVGVLKERNGWLEIRTPDEYTGWVATADLSQRAPYAAQGRTVEVTSMFAHLYRETDVTKHAPALTVPFETRLEVAGQAKDGDGERWLQVRLVDGRQLWVQRGDIRLQPRKLGVDEIVELSKRFLGLPYTWGGTSSYGYDCSGFVQMLCRQRGYVLPRDAGPQKDWKGSVAVEFKDLKPGDLLYFGSKPDNITHTGMYIGQGKFINATTFEHPVIRIDNLEAARWKALLVAAKRIP